jgi:cytochrome P450 family 9
MDDGTKFHFDKGVSIMMPFYEFHHDEKYFPDPQKFDPERFNEENRKKINPDAYMPFGSGPRNCIGSRFALMEMKAIIYYLLLNFSFEVTAKTDIPFKYENTAFAGKAANGIWIGLKPRN